MPPELLPAPAASASAVSITAADLVTQWGLVVLDLIELYRIDVHAESVRAGSCLGVRAAVLSLVSHPGSRFRREIVRASGQADGR